MSGETEDQVSGWTVDTLRAHLLQLLREKDTRDQQRFDAQQLALRDALTAQEKAVNAALLAAQTAVAKAESAAERRFESVNEFRSTLADQARDLMPRKEAEQLIAAATDRLARLEREGVKTEAHAGGRDATWAFVLAAIGTLVGVAGVILAVIASQG